MQIISMMGELIPKDCLNIIKDRKIHFMISVPAFLRLLRTTLEAEMRNALVEKVSAIQ